MTERWSQRLNRFHAKWAARARPAGGFVSQPEPRTIGSFARGRQLIAGNFLFAGYLVEAPENSLWDLPMPAPRFEEALQGFRWLDDLAAVGDMKARDRAQGWTWDWIEKYGRGTGVGWTPDLTGRRLIRWINHAIFLLRGQDRAASEAYFAALGRQTVFLSRRWHSAAPGLPRFEALTGLIYSGLSLTGMDKYVDPAIRALGEECTLQIDAQGGLPTRNPEDLLEVFTLLVWASQVMSEAGRRPGKAHVSAIERIAPTLRALRHYDGGLARFHGGERGLDGRLDHALASSGIRAGLADTLAMGFARLATARTSVIVDAARPPLGAASGNAHASTLAFELSSGRRPLVVNCGTGASFGETWRRAGRATPSHSTLGIDGFSSSRMGTADDGRSSRREELLEGPGEIRVQQSSNAQGLHFLAGHDGYVRTHGLTHVRKLTLSRDGRSLVGEDTLGALNEADRATFERIMTTNRMQGVTFSIRFHLHPDVDAEVDMGGTAVSLVLKSGEIWIFRHDGVAEMTLEPSVYLETGRLKPRATKQIVLSGRVMNFASQIGWTFAKAQDTPQGIRDTNDMAHDS